MKPTTLALVVLSANIMICTFSPSTILAAADAGEVVGDLKVGGIHFSTDNNVIRKLSDLTSPWTMTNTDIYFQGGNVGIGTLTPLVKLDVSGTVKATQFTGDGSALSNIWKTAGNAGTTPGTNFIGTTDNQPFEIRVNNQRALSINPDATSPNVSLGYFENAAGGAGVIGATVSGGGAPFFINYASGSYSTVSGGKYNHTFGEGSVICGGSSSEAVGKYSTVCGGIFNFAGGDYSFAGGTNAYVRDPHNIGNTTGDQGTFLWSDSSHGIFSSIASNEFAIRSTGGFRFVTATDVNGTPIRTTTIDANGNLTTPGTVNGSSTGNIGVYGLSTNSPGVKGESTNNTGVWGVGALMGVDANSTNGYGVHGSTGNNIAVYGVNNSTGAPAVEGWNQGSGDIFRGWSGGSPAQKFTVTNNGTVWALNGYIQGSDLRLKTDIEPLEYSLEKLLRLRGVSYVMKSDETKSRKIGVIAQELEQEYPELVITDDKGMKSVAYANLTPVLIEAVKTLKAENEALKERLERLEKLVAGIK